VKAIVSTFNVDPKFADNLVGPAFDQLATTAANGEKHLDLLSLRKHGVIEHDASLTRFDFGDAGADNFTRGDNFTPQQSLVNQLKEFGNARNGTLDWTGFGNARLLRIRQEKASDPSFTNGLKESLTALGEAVVALRLLGDGNGLPVKWMDT
jgi:hypothetical protein